MDAGKIELGAVRERAKQIEDEGRREEGEDEVSLVGAVRSCLEEVCDCICLVYSYCFCTVLIHRFMRQVAVGIWAPTCYFLE